MEDKNRKGFLLKIPNQLHRDLVTYCEINQLSMTHVIRREIEELINRAKINGIM